MILLDSSGSMGKSNSSINLALHIVKDFVETSPPTDRLGLLDFSDQTYIDITLTDIDSFRKSFSDPKTTKQIRRTGRTALFDAMVAAADYVHKTSTEGDSLFVISDGLETLNIIRSTGGTVLGVRPANSPLLQSPTSVPLYNLSTAELEKIRTDVQMIHNLIEHPYQLQFDIQPPPSSAANLQVSITNPDGTVVADKQALCPMRFCLETTSG